MLEIKELRNDLDLLDKELISLLRKRFKIVEKITRIKDEKGKIIEDSVREKEILAKIDNTCVKEIYEVMFKHAKNRTL